VSSREKLGLSGDEDLIRELLADPDSIARSEGLGIPVSADEWAQVAPRLQAIQANDPAVDYVDSLHDDSSAGTWIDNANGIVNFNFTGEDPERDKAILEHAPQPDGVRINIVKFTQAELDQWNGALSDRYQDIEKEFGHLRRELHQRPR
jgi:hypothetical protein